MKKFIYLLAAIPTLSFGEYQKQTYSCTKGPKQIYYRLAYKTAESPVPCKVYEKYSDRPTKRIGYSEKTPAICEAALNKTLARLRSQGMVCNLLDETTGAPKQSETEKPEQSEQPKESKPDSTENAEKAN